MYSLFTVSELKSELRKRNASVVGKKADLIDRLEAFDRNQNFDGGLSDQYDDSLTCPPTNTYRDMNADSPIPNINKQEIREYFLRFNMEPKGQLLYESRHLLTARYSTDGIFTILRGMCKASMKKVMYIVDIKVSLEGSIEESHCECAAGSGTSASCKHVCVLLLGAHDIVNNQMILLQESCTQQLMMFKKPKKIFQKSPIAAQNLPSKRKCSVNYNPLDDFYVMDNYENYVRNLAFGYGESTMPILQTYPPANPHGIEWDHTYASGDFKERLLEKLYLKDLSLTKIKEIEKKTCLQDSCKEWHELRSCRVTASMFYAVSHSTAAGRKLLVNNIISPKKICTRAHGKIHERIAIQKYEIQNELSVQQCGLFISLAFLAASPDGLLGEETVVEVKCPYTPRFCYINEVTVPYLENINGNLQLRKMHPYYAQIQGQLYCTNRKYCNFIVYTFKDMKVVFISRDDEYINAMIMELINFYVHHLEPAIFDKYLYKNYLKLIKPNNH